jgi:hypothetical protein
VAGDTTSTGHFTAQSGGADSGIVLGQAFSSSYVGLRTAGMAEDSADEYILISDGGDTFVSAGNAAGDDLYLRAGGNSTTCQIQLDSSENNVNVTGSLGVGASGVAGNLTVKSQNREVSILDSGSTNRAELRAHAAGDTSSYAYMQYNAYSHRFLVEGNVKAELANSGIFTTPDVPAFRAYKSGTGQVTTTGPNIWVCDTEIFDNGNNYNTSTGKFTAPVDGYYFFTWHMFMHTNYTNTTDTYWGFVATGDNAWFNHGDNGVDGGQSISALFHLDAGDVCYPYIASDSSYTLTSFTSAKYNAFNGYLVG